MRPPSKTNGLCENIVHDDGNRTGRRLGGTGNDTSAACDNRVNSEIDKFGREAGQTFDLSVSESPFNEDVLTFDVTEFVQTLKEAFNAGGISRSGARREIANPRNPSRLLCPGSERRGKEAAREHTHERPPLHYSITRSARAKSDWGIVRPSPSAVLRLMKSSNLVG